MAPPVLIGLRLKSAKEDSKFRNWRGQRDSSSHLKSEVQSNVHHKNLKIGDKLTHFEDIKRTDRPKFPEQLHSSHYKTKVFDKDKK